MMTRTPRLVYCVTPPSHQQQGTTETRPTWPGRCRGTGIANAIGATPHTDTVDAMMIMRQLQTRLILSPIPRFCVSASRGVAHARTQIQRHRHRYRDTDTDTDPDPDMYARVLHFQGKSKKERGKRAEQRCERICLGNCDSILCMESSTGRPHRSPFFFPLINGA